MKKFFVLISFLLLLVMLSGCDSVTDSLFNSRADLPTERPTEAPTERPTEAPTERPTEAPTEAVSITYIWYDADGSVLYTATVLDGENIPEYALPEDTNTWDYTEWEQKGETFHAVREKITTYTWFDADGTFLNKEVVPYGDEAPEYEIPADTEMWNYTGWTEDGQCFYANREPQSSYFVGNVFQIVISDLGEIPVATGTGFVFSKDGWFITNAHVMEDAYYATAIFNIENKEAGESFTYLDIVYGTYYHIDKDIYIGRIENYEEISDYYHEISLNQNYEIGATSYSVGYPSSSVDLQINEGEITEQWSNLYDKLYSGNTYVCSSSYIAPGSSGGILVNDNLEVIGITTLGETDENDEFVCGYAISTFNFSNLIKNNGDKTLTSLQDKFHPDEKVYIAAFNYAKNSSNTKYNYYDNDTVGYTFEWISDKVNNEGEAYYREESLTFYSDGFITYNDEIYWESSGRRTVSFYGFYDDIEQFDNFIYEFKYTWNDGKWYSVTSTDINYSPNTSLTLNKYTLDSSYRYTPSDSNIEYFKECFNGTYEWLTDWMSSYLMY